MFNFPLELEPSDADLEEEAEEEEEEEEIFEEEIDERTNFLQEEIAECFALFDKNKTKTMDSKFLERAMKCLGIVLPPEEQEEAAENLDSGGVIEFERFRDFAFERLSEMEERALLKVAFQNLDVNFVGTIPSEKLRRLVMTLGNPLTEKEARELIKLGDPSNKGHVIYDDLIAFLLSK